MTQVAIDLRLHPKQGMAFLSPAQEILYGGAAGGGKSHLMRVLAIALARQVPGLNIYLFRRLSSDLIKNHIEGTSGFRALLAPLVQAKLIEIVGDEVRFLETGAKIFLCHCKDEKDRFKYQGSEIHVLLIDELTHFTEKIYRFLRGRCRAIGLVLPKDFSIKFPGLTFPKIVVGANPGGIGHGWVKRTFIDNAIPMQIRMTPESEGGMLRQYIPARMDDNPTLMRDDPTYRARLRGLGSDALVRAMEQGDWGIIDGAFFDCWKAEKHQHRPFKIPDDWLRFASGDWGSARPFSFGWWAVAGEDFKTPGGFWLPRGCMIRYQEWYGCKKDASGISQDNIGLKLPAETVGKRIAERESSMPKLAYRVLDPAAFSSDGGPSIAERLYTGSSNKISFRKADNARIARDGAMGGWDQMRSRLIGDDDERPMLITFDTCLDSIRTIPMLQHDENRIEDLNSDSEDHAADDWRYGCMSRPYLPQKIAKKEPVFLNNMTFNDLINQSDQSTSTRSRRI